MKKEVNGLIWHSMVSKNDMKTGFELTDTDNDSKITREEDNMANLLYHDFELLDTFTQAGKTDGLIKLTSKNTALNDKTPSEAADGKLDKWELNSKFPMWEVNNLMTTYG
jgi:hypothetical protein